MTQHRRAAKIIKLKWSCGVNSLQFQDQPALEFKGRLEPVELTTATRSGNKKVTLVNNLETYHIDPLQFAHKCQVVLFADILNEVFAYSVCH